MGNTILENHGGGGYKEQYFSTIAKKEIIVKIFKLKLIDIKIMGDIMFANMSSTSYSFINQDTLLTAFSKTSKQEIQHEWMNEINLEKQKQKGIESTLYDTVNDDPLKLLFNTLAQKGNKNICINEILTIFIITANANLADKAEVLFNLFNFEGKDRLNNKIVFIMCTMIMAALNKVFQINMAGLDSKAIQTTILKKIEERRVLINSMYKYYDGDEIEATLEDCVYCLSKVFKLRDFLLDFEPEHYVKQLPGTATLNHGKRKYELLYDLLNTSASYRYFGVDKKVIKKTVKPNKFRANEVSSDSSTLKFQDRRSARRDQVVQFIWWFNEICNTSSIQEGKISQFDLIKKVNTPAAKTLQVAEEFSMCFEHLDNTKLLTIWDVLEAMQCTRKDGSKDSDLDGNRSWQTLKVWTEETLDQIKSTESDDTGRMLTKRELYDMRKLFLQWDEDGSNSIDEWEFYEKIESQPFISSKDAKRKYKMFDMNQDKGIDFNEFVQLLMAPTMNVDENIIREVENINFTGIFKKRNKYNPDK